MREKIIDITPPGRRSEPEKIFFEKSKKKHFKKKFSFILLIISVSVVFLFFIIWLASPLYAKLELEISPLLENRTFEQDIEVNIAQSSSDIQNKIIPGRFFEKEETKKGTFKTTGREITGAKSEGIIRVYNSTNPVREITLRASTRFLSSDGGKIFHCPDKIYLPAAQIVNGKVIPSYKDVRVVAQEEGDDYNISPSRFSVPGLVGNSLYYSVWAESEEAITGGSKNEIEVVSREDIDLSKEGLRGDLLDLVKESMKNDLPEGFSLNEDSLLVEEFESSCSEDVGENVSEINCEGRIKVKGLAFIFSDVKEIAVNYIRGNISEEEDFNIENLKIEFFSKNLLSSSGKVVLNAKINFDLYKKIPVESIALNIRGLLEKEIRDFILENYSQVKEANLSFKPFWVRKAPKDIKKIKVKLTF